MAIFENHLWNLLSQLQSLIILIIWLFTTATSLRSWYFAFHFLIGPLIVNTRKRHNKSQSKNSANPNKPNLRAFAFFLFFIIQKVPNKKGKKIDNPEVYLAQENWICKEPRCFPEILFIARLLKPDQAMTNRRTHLLTSCTSIFHK